MEIKATGGVSSTNVRRVSRGSASGGTVFKPVETAEPPYAQTVSGPGPIAAVETILMLQSFDDTTDGRSKGLAHGEELLDMLDQVRDGLLAGGIPRTILNRLASAVSRRQESFADPQLQSVLDEIDLRARVELAKLEMSDRATS